VEDFRLRIVQVKGACSDLPLHSTHAAVLNAVNYVTEVLKQWNELPVCSNILLPDKYF
jgi:hypothetical protein